MTSSLPVMDLGPRSRDTPRASGPNFNGRAASRPTRSRFSPCPADDAGLDSHRSIRQRLATFASFQEPPSAHPSGIAQRVRRVFMTRVSFADRPSSGTSRGRALPLPSPTGSSSARVVGLRFHRFIRQRLATVASFQEPPSATPSYSCSGLSAGSRSDRAKTHRVDPARGSQPARAPRASQFSPCPADDALHATSWFDST